MGEEKNLLRVGPSSCSMGNGLWGVGGGAAQRLMGMDPCVHIFMCA